MGLIKDFLALCGFGARTKKEEVPVKSDVSAKVKPDLVADTAALFGVGPVGKKVPVSASDTQKSVVKETGHKSKVSEPRSGSWNIKPGQGGVSPQSKAVASRHDDRHESDGSVGMGLANPLHPLSPLSPWNIYQDTDSPIAWRRSETTPPAPAESSPPVSSHSYSGGNSCDRVSTSHVESTYSSPAPTYSCPSPSSCSDSSSSDSGGGGGGGGGD